MSFPAAFQLTARDFLASCRKNSSELTDAQFEPCAAQIRKLFKPDETIAQCGRDSPFIDDGTRDFSSLWVNHG